MPDPTFTLYNTLTRKPEKVEPIEKGHLRFYSCGPTVYSYAHIGNFRTFLTADLIARVAEALGWKVTYVSNITDVGHLTEDDVADAAGEDKMQKALRSKEGEAFSTIWDLARHYAQALIEDWQRLNLREPTIRPRATEHVTEQIDAIEQLVRQGHAYQTEGGVYFSVTSFPGYGQLSGNTLDAQTAQAVRDVVVDADKRDPRDFALWKRDPGHLMQWHSPFGRGYPGWHIECSVMARKYLGDTLDLHAGGEDLIFPHHECEIAQSESLTGEPFSHLWVHTRFLQVEGEKMSKSKGNFFTVRDLVEDDGVDGLVLRYALLSGQYRKPLNFTRKNLQDSARAVTRYREAAEAVQKSIGAQTPGDDRIGDRLETIYQKTLAALCDDLNTPEALAASLEGVKLITGLGSDLNSASAQQAQAWLDKSNRLLGFISSEYEKRAAETIDPLAQQLDTLKAARDEARKRRDWAESDRLRDEMLALGVEVRDTAEGTVWKRRLG